MQPDVRRTIEQFAMLLQHDKVVVGVSGGPDSMALLHILLSLKVEYSLELYVAHVNHMFRGSEAQADADFVRETARQWDVPCFIINADVPARMITRGLSAQVAGRETRYQYFNHITAITGATKIAVGHTADDQAETVLMRFLRGAGPDGLAGIPPVRSGIVRPLIHTRRNQVEEYCCTQNIDFRRDASNLKPVYLRNRIRNQLLPLLEGEYNNSLRKNLVNLADILQGEEDYWSNMVNLEFDRCVQHLDDGPHILAAPFKQSALAIQRRVIRKLLTDMHISDAGFLHIEKLRELLTQGVVGQATDLPGAYFAIKTYCSVVLKKKQSRTAIEPTPQIALTLPGSTYVPELGIVVQTTFVAQTDVDTGQFGGFAFDWDRLNKPICVRTRRHGDMFYHNGIGHRKKLKEFFINQKVPQDQRDKVPIVTHGTEILIVYGYYVDKRLLADKDTKSTLQIIIREG